MTGSKKRREQNDWNDVELPETMEFQNGIVVCEEYVQYAFVSVPPDMGN